MRLALAIAASLLAWSALSATAAAQDAAESAILTSGSGAAQVRGGRSLGSAISGGMTTAADRLRPRAHAPAPATVRRRPHERVVAAAPLPADVDPLEGSDAAEYRLGNGATITVGGGFRPSASAACATHCTPTPPAAEEPAASAEPLPTPAPEPAPVSPD